MNPNDINKLLNEILDHQVANRGTVNAFYSCYTYSHKEMPAWVAKAEAMRKLKFTKIGVEKEEKTCEQTRSGVTGELISHCDLNHDICGRCGGKVIEKEPEPVEVLMTKCRCGVDIPVVAIACKKCWAECDAWHKKKKEEEKEIDGWV